MASPIDLDRKWVHYLTRPFSLFGASLWHAWYASKELRQLLSIPEPEALFIEEPKGIVRHYRIDSQMEQYWEAGLKFVRENPERCKELLKKGVLLNAQAQKMLKKREKAFPTVQAAVEFLISVGINATIIPYLTLKGIEELKIKDKELCSLAEQLRNISYYPTLIQKIIIPLAREELRRLNVSEADRAVEVITLNEILSQRITEIPSRLKLREAGKQFVYQVLKGKESIQWSAENAKRVLQVEKIATSETREIRGQVAYPGKVEGKAKIVLGPSGKEATFEEGDILVTINSNPSLLPVIKKAAAIVTDEGGITCHAAIISRELKKPCVIGTKMATSIIKEGDLIEVDANAGIVRIRKPAEKVDWGVYLDRRHYLFVFATYVLPSGILLQKETGFQYTHQLYNYTPFQSVFYRSQKEMNQADAHFLRIILNRDPRLEKWYQKGLKYLKLQEKLVKEFSGGIRLEYVQKNYQKIFDECQLNYLYCTIIPFRILSAIDTALKQGQKKELFSSVLLQFEQFRKNSREPVVEKVFTAFWKAAAQLTRTKNHQDLSYLTPAELEEVFRSGQNKYLKEIEQRKKGCAFWYESENQQIHFSYDPLFLEKQGIKKTSVSEDSELKGTIACKGIARGRISIVNTTQDFPKFRKGDIIVSINTNPSLMPVLKMASAIVTDEGGITCHAAIISRELKIPCIIGTKHATSILKNGDIVEVNAEKGIVKILKRA